MASYLADKSALVRIGLAGAEWLAAEIVDGNVRRSSTTDLEIFSSATSHRALLEVIEERQAGFRLVETQQVDWDRAVEAWCCSPREASIARLASPIYSSLQLLNATG